MIQTVLDETDSIKNVEAPKNIERLEEISTQRAIQRQLEEEDTDEEDRIKISTEQIYLSGFDVLDNEPGIKPNADPFVLNDVEELY